MGMIIMHWPLSNEPLDNKYKSSDEKLISFIEEYKLKYIPLDVEIFYQEGNILVTERGFYGAFYENDFIIRRKINNILL